MDIALVASALLMGLAGAPHCMTMCGAAFGTLALQGGAARVSESTLALHLGRLIGYSAAGAAVAASVGSLAALTRAAPLLGPLWTLVHVGAVALGLWLVWKARAPAWLSSRSPAVVALQGARPLRFFKRVPPVARAGMAGACWAAIPCGLLQSALLVAALASGPAQGAAVMAAFATASAVGLWLGPSLWRRLRGIGAEDRAATWPIRGAGVLLAAASLFALWHGLDAAIADALCRVTG